MSDFDARQRPIRMTYCTITDGGFDVVVSGNCISRDGVPTGLCTGVAASWCPYCGDCSCTVDENESLWPVRDDACPLHGTASKHNQRSISDGEADAMSRVFGGATGGERCRVAVRPTRPDSVGPCDPATNRGSSWR